ncbi:MAG: outer membrane beta-barrel protein [Woeseiaceae bacterium]|nr:outer membrane beta-barrel protein [Woeseiaceae bacterium]
MTALNRNNLSLIALLIGGFAANAANAQDDQRWYGTASVGFGNLASSTLTYSDGTSTSSADADYETSFAGGGTLGYRFASGWNLEGEIMYRRNELDPISIAGLGDFTEGDFASLSFGVNALYRFQFGNSGKWSGYAGPGVVYLQEIDIDFEVDGQETSFETDDIAFQLKFGTRYDFNERWFIDAGATYFIADGVEMEFPADRSQTITSDYEHWNLQLGAGFRF